MNKISWQHAEIHYSKRGGQNYGAAEETEVLLELINLSYWWTHRERQPDKGRENRCAASIHKNTNAGIRLLSASVLSWTQPAFHSGSIYFGFHPRVPRHTDSLQLSSDYCIKARTQDVVYSAEPGTPMTTTFDLRHTLSGKTYLDHREPDLNKGKTQLVIA